MSGLYFVLPTLFAILISMLVVRAGAVALVMTGMHIDKAKFQALSAFSGTGFTTREAEAIVNHPARRKIVSWLMVFGNAGVVAVIVTATSTLVSSEGIGVPISAVVLAVGIVFVYAVATRAGVIKTWESYVQEKLGRSTVFEDRPVEELLHLLEGYELVRARVEEGSPLSNKTLAELDLPSIGCLVLTIEREEKLLATPSGDTKIADGDRVVMYGRLDELQKLLGREAVARGF